MRGHPAALHRCLCVIASALPLGQIGQTRTCRSHMRAREGWKQKRGLGEEQLTGGAHRQGQQDHGARRQKKSISCSRFLVQTLCRRCILIPGPIQGPRNTVPVARYLLGTALACVCGCTGVRWGSGYGATQAADLHIMAQDALTLRVLGVAPRVLGVVLRVLGVVPRENSLWRA